MLTADDSALIRLTLNRYLNRYSDVEVVGQASNGRELLSLAASLRPDVVVSDVEMPEMNGLEALAQLMRTNPIPVIMLSNLTSEGAEVTMQALEIGAFDFVVKPQPGVTMAETVEILIEKIRHAAEAPARLSGRLSRAIAGVAGVAQKQQSTSKLVAALQASDTLLMVASSTGGPSALTGFFSAIAPDLPIGGVIVQHMPAGFTTILSERLDKSCHYRVLEAKPGAKIQRGQFLVAPGGSHLIFDEKGVAHLSDAPTVNGVRPAADVTMKSLAKIYKDQILAVVLTGMGKDGYAGAQEISQCGGKILAQDEDSCVVYGMPRHIIESNLAQGVGSPESLGRSIAGRVTE
ncbi:MAG: chemotaxis-specific protein-glutamate methyltransferase CheB [Caldilineaceae bacterium]